MPIFDYYCTHCQHRVEMLQKLNEPNPLTCPACREPKLVRQLSAPKVRLAGTGWYETDEKPKAKQRNIVQADSSESN